MTGRGSYASLWAPVVGVLLWTANASGSVPDPFECMPCLPPLMIIRSSIGSTQNTLTKHLPDIVFRCNSVPLEFSTCSRFFPSLVSLTVENTKSSIYKVTTSHDIRNASHLTYFAIPEHPLMATTIAPVATIQLPAASRLLPTSWCPDKDLLVVTTHVSHQEKMTLYKMQGSKKWEVTIQPQLLGKTEAEVVAVAWSPDGTSAQ